ncbi:hypothetical protein XENOCAPTIV_022251 [Xenoophorus captivus]|uniref:Uncharacterized protein n=1 Tax=Xenoophorus captivus TaxID=1517983 RepID=A0ABV0S167_9TELE
MADYYNDTELLTDAPADERRPSFLIPSGHSSSMTVLRGHVLEMECIAEGLPTPDISWTKVSGDLPSRRTSFLHFNKTLQIVNVSESDAGDYRCTARNQHGFAHHTISVAVKAEPPRVLTPANKLYQVIENHPVLMDCSSFGSPIPKIKWFKDSRSSTLDGDSYILHDNGTLEIQVAQAQHKGKYICVASNMLGIYENHVYLETREPTRIINQSDDMVVQRGRSVVFECKVKHDKDLMPTMTWLKDNEEMPEDERLDASFKYLCLPSYPSCLLMADLSTKLYISLLPSNFTESTPAPAVIHEFVIQYEDSLLHPGHWHDLARVPGTKTTAHLKLSPYVHYTFRVLARNAVGLSVPSSPSRMYKTDPAGFSTKQYLGKVTLGSCASSFNTRAYPGIQGKRL